MNNIELYDVFVMEHLKKLFALAHNIIRNLKILFLKNILNINGLYLFRL